MAVSCYTSAFSKSDCGRLNETSLHSKRQRGEDKGASCHRPAPPAENSHCHTNRGPVWQSVHASLLSDSAANAFSLLSAWISEGSWEWMACDIFKFSGWPVSVQTELPCVLEGPVLPVGVTWVNHLIWVSLVQSWNKTLLGLKRVMQSVTKQNPLYQTPQEKAAILWLPHTLNVLDLLVFNTGYPVRSLQPQERVRQKNCVLILT